MHIRAHTCGVMLHGVNAFNRCSFKRDVDLPGLLEGMGNAGVKLRFGANLLLSDVPPSFSRASQGRIEKYKLEKTQKVGFKYCEPENHSGSFRRLCFLKQYISTH
jgi:hypothetical protein